MRKFLAYLLLGCAVFFAWRSFSRAAQETVVLHTATLANQDHFATLWVVEDDGRIWIRAETRQRRWLAAVLARPEVELRRAGTTRRYQALPFDNPEAVATVDALFRTKYGLADRLRELATDRDPLPIRLDPL
ncbi:MAG TPA: DUF2255 family protein [Myxococcota bacterium]|nr:DUF2255 family protein [Myxococcota bacterium]